MARPKAQIDYTIVKAMADVLCTQAEIASALDLSVRTLQRDTEFSRIYKKGIDNGKASLRRKQFALADKNATMGIWLGKQLLGQKDKQELEHKGSIQIEIKGNVKDWAK